MRYDILELVTFHTFSIIIVVLNVDLNIEHVWKTMIFKMLHPMTYTCYPFETWRGYCIHPGC